MATKAPIKFKSGVKAGSGLTGAKAKIFAMMQRKNGTTAAEICKALGWVQCGATVSRTIKAVGKSKVRKERGDDGIVRYIATA
jgi:arginine repressor